MFELDAHLVKTRISSRYTQSINSTCLMTPTKRIETTALKCTELGLKIGGAQSIFVIMQGDVMTPGLSRHQHELSH